MNLEFIQELWEKDSVIDNDLLHSESTRVPALHAKYYKIYNNILTLKKAQETKFKILKKIIIIPKLKKGTNLPFHKAPSGT